MKKAINQFEKKILRGKIADFRISIGLDKINTLFSKKHEDDTEDDIINIFYFKDYFIHDDLPKDFSSMKKGLTSELFDIYLQETGF